MAAPPKFPLRVFEDFEIAKGICTDFVNRKQDVFSLNCDENHYIKITEKFNKHDFYFHIFEPHLSNHKTLFNIMFAPESRASNNKTQYKIEYPQLLQLLETWSSLVENLYKYHPDNYLVNAWTNYYFEDFKIHDEDADVTPFSETQQKALIYIAEIVENSLKTNEVQIDAATLEIISEVELFKKHLVQSPKNVAMKSWSKILSKIHLKGKPFFNKVLSTARDAWVKYMVEKGVDYIIDLGERFLMHHV